MGRISEKKDKIKMQELFIPISLHVKLFPEEIIIINHAAFQRLRRLRQLGLAHLLYPGATHSRFEHSIGTLNVSQKIIDHVNENYERKAKTVQNNANEWKISNIDYITTRFIRLSALLHDIGHVPLGHTLEDELSHLPDHDGQDRLDSISNRKFTEYTFFIDQKETTTQQDGWSLKDLINTLYHDYMPDNLQNKISPYKLISHLICKNSPQNQDATIKEKWEEDEKNIKSHFEINVCKDIVGNTICADFLDYIFRDWYHIGKIVIEDPRLYQYMEVLEGKEESVFVINVGQNNKLRHDALTSIMELLESRYKLTETVLFHRTKLSFIALLDRCLLEIRDLYKVVGIEESDFTKLLETLLLKGSDDGLYKILEELKDGGDEKHKEDFKVAISKLNKEIENEDKKQGNLDKSENPILEKQELIKKLILRLMNRNVYSQVYELIDFNDIIGLNEKEKKFLDLYAKPANRFSFLEKIEGVIGVPKGSITMYCPYDTTMNAKIAEVKIYINDVVMKFNDYEIEAREKSLTGGTLEAQLRRFHKLWSTSIFMHKSSWVAQEDDFKSRVPNILNSFLLPTDQPKIKYEETKGLIEKVNPSLKQAARQRKGETFPNGLLCFHQ